MTKVKLRQIRRAFTLVEMLVVIGIIALLAAILFPVFAQARGRARQAVCLSNLRQLGIAISAYTHDYDDQYPNGADPSDKYSQPSIWSGGSAAQLPLLNHDPHVAQQPGVLTPYVKSDELWHCPSDKGYTQIDMFASSSLQAMPTAYDAYGTSYLSRTEIALQHVPYSMLVTYDQNLPCAEHSLAEVNVLMDGNGSWHGGLFSNERRYTVLMADGHCVSQDLGMFTSTWSRTLLPVKGCPNYAVP